MLNEDFENADPRYAAELAMHGRIRALGLAVQFHANDSCAAELVVTTAKVFEQYLTQTPEKTA